MPSLKQYLENEIMAQTHKLPTLLNEIECIICQVINMELHMCCEDFLPRRHQQCLSPPSKVSETN